MNMEFIEAPVFSKYLSQYLNDEEYSAFQWYLAQNPESGDIIPGSGGLRKIRWRKKDTGKRGGLRIIYYYLTKKGEIWLLTIYAKNEMENIPNNVLKALKEELVK